MLDAQTEAEAVVVVVVVALVLLQEGAWQIILFANSRTVT